MNCPSCRADFKANFFQIVLLQELKCSSCSKTFSHSLLWRRFNIFSYPIILMLMCFVLFDVLHFDLFLTTQDKGPLFFIKSNPKVVFICVGAFVIQTTQYFLLFTKIGKLNEGRPSPHKYQIIVINIIWIIFGPLIVEVYALFSTLLKSILLWVTQ